MVKKVTHEKLDFDHRVSQLLKLPYKNYSSHDGNALELLSSLKDKSSFSIEWDKEKKRFSLIVYTTDGCFGQMFKGDSVASVIKQYFLSFIK